MMLKIRNFLLFSVMVTSLFLGSGYALYAMDDEGHSLSFQSPFSSQTPLETIPLDESGGDVGDLRSSIINDVVAQMRQNPDNSEIGAWIKNMIKEYSITSEELQVDHGE